MQGIASPQAIRVHTSPLLIQLLVNQIMKHSLLILIFFLFCSFTGNSQSQTAVSIDFYKTISCLKLVDVISPKQLYGEMIIVYGTSGIIITLDSIMNYKQQFFDCTSRTLADKGTWEIINKRMLQINSNRFGKMIYDIVRYEGVYYFVEPFNRKQFLLSITRESSTSINDNSFIIDGKKYIHVHNTPVAFDLNIFSRKSLGADNVTRGK